MRATDVLDLFSISPTLILVSDFGGFSSSSQSVSMVTTRRRRRAAEDVQQTPSASPEPHVRDIDIEPVGLRKGGSVASTRSPPSADSTPPETPPASPRVDPLDMPASDRTVRSHSAHSMLSFAGPGQRGAQLLAAAPADARNAYLNSLENMNEEFVECFRDKGITLPRGEFLLLSTPTLSSATRVRLPVYRFSYFSHIFTHSRPLADTHSRLLRIRFFYAFASSTHSRLLLYAFASFHAFASFLPL